MSRTTIKELIDITNEHNGRLSPEDVVEYARDPSTALHSCFEWDETEAARKYRLEQAKHIIRVSVQILAGTNEDQRVFVSLQEDRGDKDEGSYRLLLDVLNDDEMRDKLLEQARKDFLIWKRKYETLKELVPVFEAMMRTLH